VWAPAFFLSLNPFLAGWNMARTRTMPTTMRMKTRLRPCILMTFSIQHSGMHELVFILKPQAILLFTNVNDVKC